MKKKMKIPQHIGGKTYGNKLNKQPNNDFKAKKKKQHAKINNKCVYWWKGSWTILGPFFDKKAVFLLKKKFFL